MEWIWYLSGFLIGYVYVGYPVLLWVWSLLFGRESRWDIPSEWPTVSFIVPAYNEIDFLPTKLQNVLELDYPVDKLEVIWVVEGSTDGSEAFLQEAISKVGQGGPRMKVLGGPTRRGKSYAIEEGVSVAMGEIVVISDANTLLPPHTLKALVLPFQDPAVGAVAGEKRVVSDDSLAGESESLYWRYESFIKTHMSRVFGCIGTIGELYAIRKSDYPPLRPHSYCMSEDLIPSMELLRAAKKVVYVPHAYTLEAPSANARAEFKRKIRIASCTPLTVRTYPEWFYFWRHPQLSFHFFSYKLLRWYAVPLALPTFLISNAILISEAPLFTITMGLQAFFYFCGTLGLSGIKGKIFRLPAYFLLANAAQILGVIKYLRDRKHGKPFWEKIQRKTL